MRLIATAVKTVVLVSVALLCAFSDRTGSAQSSIAVSSQEDIRGVKRIEIESSAWSGRKTIPQRLVIRATKTGYSAGNRTVDGEAIRELLASFNSTPRTLDLQALGISREWLRQNGFNDGAGFLEAVNEYYRDTVILDVDAELSLELVQANRSRIRVRSSQSHAYMIPWTITTPNGEFQTYDVGVSRAIMRLLPDGFVNRLIIAGTPHGRDFSHEIGAIAKPMLQ